MSGVTFDKVTTTALRIEADLREGFSACVLEWRVGQPGARGPVFQGFLPCFDESLAPLFGANGIGEK